MKLLSTKEFAEMAGVTIRTLKNWRKSGKLVPAAISDKGEKFYTGVQLQEVDNFPIENSTNGKMENESKNLIPIVNLSNPPKLIIPNDKATNNIFDNQNKDERRGVLEWKKPKIISPLNVDWCGYKQEGLNAFDRAVFNACVTEKYFGNKYTTLARIYRAMGGNETKLTSAMKDRILHSVRKLQRIHISYNCTKYAKYRKWEGKIFIYEGAILPCEFIQARVGGKILDAVIHFFDSDSPLMESVLRKGQFLSCDKELLKVEGLKNTPTAVKIKSYLHKRIEEVIRSHRGGKRVTKLNNTIELETLLKACDLLEGESNLSAVDRDKFYDTRKTIEKILNWFIEEDFLSSWNFEKRNEKIFSIKFSWK